MKKKTILALTIVLTVVLTLALAGCDNGATSGKQTDKGTNPDPVTLSPALRAVPTASGSPSNPMVLGSRTDGSKNYYLIDVGYVKNVFISTILEAAYNGMTPISVSKTTINENTITESLADTISNSITVSSSVSTKIGIEEAVKATIPGEEFSVKLNLELASSISTSNASTRSTQTSVSDTKKVAESYSTSFTIGEHGEPAGNYRYALYAVCDVYFIISTSLDNQKLLSWDTAVCSRSSTLIPHWDYSQEGLFDNSPNGNEITFNEGFYKNLPQPQKTDPADDSQTVIKTDFITIRTDTLGIDASGRFNQPLDRVNFDSFGINIDAMKLKGYKTISFYIQLNVREINDGYQHIFLFSSTAASDTYLISELRFEHSPSKDTSWRVHYETELKFENISIDKFPNNEFIIRYDASGSGDDDWENKDLKVQLVIKK